MVLKNTSIILFGADPEFVSAEIDQEIAQILAAGGELFDLVTEIAGRRQQEPGDDLISALATANLDGEQLTKAELASFSFCW